MTKRDQDSSAATPGLRVASVLQPVVLDALDDVRRRQLEIANKRYTGREEVVELILSSDREEEDDEGESIHPGFLELRTIVGADDAPKYDAWLYMVDSGTIFEAGTETVVAEVIQFGLECADEALSRQLEPVVGRLGESDDEDADED